ncbi:MAG: MFS transporter [Legionella sp.]|nr:MAG: MFS transporter [Legionella sp.]
MNLTQPKISKKSILIWLVGVSFLLFQFFLQLSSGIVIGSIMQEEHLSALCAGILSSAFYYIYTSMQIPVGMLFDRYNTRRLLYLNAIICALGCFIFAAAQTFMGLFIARLIIGAGSAFAFIGMSQLLRQHFPLRYYAFLIGLSETLGFSLTVVGMIGMGTTINELGWRSFIYAAGVLGLLIAFLCWKLIPDHIPTTNQEHQYKKQLFSILKNKLAWINGLFVGLEFSVITVFAALWAVPFLQLKLNCDLRTSSVLTSMVLLGAGLSCPLFGQLSMYFSRRKPLLHLSCLSTAALMLIALYAPIHNLFIYGLLLFAIGLCCGAYMLAYSIANELAPSDSLATCTGFTNTLAMLSAPLLQPLVGYVLDLSSDLPGVYILEDYQTALFIIPLALVIASGLVCFLPEKPQH